MTDPAENPRSQIIAGLRHAIVQIGKKYPVGYSQSHYQEVAESIIAVMDSNNPEADVANYTEVHLLHMNTATPTLYHPSQTEVRDVVNGLLEAKVSLEEHEKFGKDDIYYRTFSTNDPAIIIEAVEVNDIFTHEQRTRWNIWKKPAFEKKKQRQ